MMNFAGDAGAAAGAPDDGRDRYELQYIYIYIYIPSLYIYTVFWFGISIGMWMSPLRNDDFLLENAMILA